MADKGVRTNTVDPVDYAVEVIVNGTTDTGRMPFTAFVAQMAAEGAVSDLLSGFSTALTGQMATFATTISQEITDQQTTFDAALATQSGTVSAALAAQLASVNGTVAAVQASIDAAMQVAVAGTNWVPSVAVATTANITLSGEQTIDGVPTSTSSVLVKDQTTSSQNGIYTTGPGTWTRRADADEQNELIGLAVYVRGGTTNGGKQYVQTTKGTITVGTTAVAFRLVSDQSALNANLAAKADQTTLDARVQKIGDVANGYLFEWIDAIRRRVAGIRLDGTFEVAGQAISDLVKSLLSSVASNSRAPGASTGYLFEWLDAAGRRLGGWRIDGTFDINGAPIANSARLDPTLRADGIPNAPLYAPWRLREMRRLLRGLAAGTAGTQLVINFHGDSWTDGRGYYVQAVAKALQALFGDAGAGYVGAGKGAADSDKATLNYTGSWTYAVNSRASPSTVAPFPSLSSYTSSTAGDKLTLAVLTQADAINILYTGGSGVVRYRYNGGGWTTLALDGSATTQVKAVGTPPSGVALSLEVEVVSGTCTIGGFDVRRSQNGVRVNKCGSGGARALDFTFQNEVDWRNGIIALGAYLDFLLLGVNDRGDGTVSEFLTNLTELVRRLRVASPLGDICMMSPPETLGSYPSKPMSTFSYVSRTVAELYEAAHLDLQSFFGKQTADYGDAGRQYILAADNAHPTTDKGGPVIRDAVIRTIINS